MKVLGIETSCDETSVAILDDGKVAANLISSQDFHTEYGGVVPELSSRAHLQMVLPLYKKALQTAQISINEIDLICSTAGPGLIGALLVGLTFAKGLAYSARKEFLGVNHIEGHIYSGFLMERKPEFPYLCLVVSGGHTLLLIVKSDTEIVKLGSTIDDAAGEAFDKVAKMLGLGYPGGPKISEAALNAADSGLNFPVAHCKNELDFSFSGLKTAVLRHIQKEYGTAGSVPPDERGKIAFAFQKSLVSALTRNALKALNRYRVKSISIVGGVAANKLLREEFSNISEKIKVPLIVPANEYCGDNGAMIALRGYRAYKAGMRSDFSTNAFASLSQDHFKN